ncbi:MAG TPA: radical SAM protein [bacterium]|nr:radical SAM protein [bacterium]
MKKFDFYISYLCGSDCVFCCVLDKIKWFRDFGIPPHIPFEEIAGTLKSKREENYSYVTFTGGEPTLHPDFPKIVRLARELGYRISVNSNMSRFADPGYCRETLPYINEIVASVHGHTPELHNTITGTEKAMEKFMSAMDNIHRLDSDIYLITDTVLFTMNLPHISEMCDFLAGIPKLRHVLFSNMNIPPDATEGLRDYVATLPDIEKELPVIVEKIAVRGNRILRFYGLPFCTLKDYSGYSSDLYFEPKRVLERVKQETGMKEREYSAPKPTMAKKKTEKCSECIYFKTCGGFFNSYYEIYGDEHIKPILRG